ncbi:cytochrome c oxidase assembly protein [Tessaracoccus sp. G1721]
MPVDHGSHGGSGMGLDPGFLWMILGFVLTVGYLAATVVQRRSGHRWAWGKQASWYIGVASLLASTLGSWADKAADLLSWHMAQHMMLSMVTPILLILGQPVTLVLRALGSLGTPARPARAALLRLVHSRFVATVTHPLITLVLFVASLYGLYFSPLLDWLMRTHLGHQLMLVHFLLVGLLYFTPILAVEPLRRRLSPPARLFVMLPVVPFHAFFGVIVMSSGGGLSQHFAARTLALGLDPSADQSLAGGLAWASGELPLLALIVVVAIQWVRHDRLLAQRTDRHADRTDDEELVAYNAHLARLAAVHNPRSS